MNRPDNSSISGRQAALTDPIPLIIDSGTTLSLLPREVVESIAATFPDATPDGSGGYTVDCAWQFTNGSIDFNLGDITINVPYSDFIWNTGGPCYLGAWSSNLSVVVGYILGDTFIRAVYSKFHGLFSLVEVFLS